MKSKYHGPRVGYVKFISKRPRKEVENLHLRFRSAKDHNLIYDKGICVVSLEDEVGYEIMIIGLSDNFSIKDIRLCNCKNIREVSKSRYKNKKLKIPYGYHLYEAKVYGPIPSKLLKIIPLKKGDEFYE